MPPERVRATRRPLPAIAGQLFPTHPSEAAFERFRDDLIVLGVPDGHLPRTLAEQRARQTLAGLETTVTF